MQKLFFRIGISIIFLFMAVQITAQDYYFKEYHPFNSEIPSPEEFLGYPIGQYHTRYDLVTAYFEKLAELSDRASLHVYGKTYENRKLLMLTITSPAHLKNIEQLQKKHLEVVDPKTNVKDFSELPIFIELGYGVHGNEPSSTEAAMLTAYTLIASENPKVKEYLEKAVIFIDPTINPDGRDRHTNWANRYRGNPFIADKYDIEHNEAWPYGRTNHYWFDLNRDLLLGVHPESNGRLKWYHEWYPNVVTDFHEMGTQSTYFFEPKNHSAAWDPITPAENYTKLNNLFAKQFSKDLDKIGSLYFTGERFDATYPGYGSTYMDLKGSLALLFEQASSRGHLQETPTGEISFSFTIRNQFVSSFATIKAAINNKDVLYDYQNRFYKESLQKATKSKVKAYVFGEDFDKNRTKAFVDVLLKHHIDVYKLDNGLRAGKSSYKAATSFIVPTHQKEYLMVRNIFETNEKYRDSVFYDASAWSLVNFYNMKYNALTKLPSFNKASKVTAANNTVSVSEMGVSRYAYLIPWDDYYAPAVLNALQEKGIIVKIATEPFEIPVNGNVKAFDRGTLMIPVADQKPTSDELHQIVNKTCLKFNVQGYGVKTGFMTKGHGLGSNSLVALKAPKVMMVVEESVSSYEAGEVWHLFEQRLKMPIVKVPERIFSRADLNRYNVIIMVSGNFRGLSKSDKDRLKEWVAEGNTLITTRKGSSWVIQNKIVNEELLSAKNDSAAVNRLNYSDAYGTIGKQSIGGAIFRVDLDITHPIGYGYHNRSLPVYKNSNVFLKPTKSRFSNVAMFTANPHIDGYITPENLNKLKGTAYIIVSKIGKGRVVLFSDNPNFRGSWYGTNKLFINAVFFGNIIKTPK